MARFLQLSDLHMVPNGKLASDVLDTGAILTSAIDRLIEKKDHLAPLDAVLVTGDISDDGSPESYELARAQLERLGLPLFVVPGNHDSREPFREAFSNLSSMPREDFIDWVETVEDTRIIGLDTLVEGQGAGLLRQESLTFLANELSQASNSAVVIMLHHPPLRTGIQFMDGIGLENPAELAQILNQTDADVTVLAGHVHGVHYGRIGGYPVLTAPAVCSNFVLDRRDHAPIGFFSGPTGCAVLETGQQGNWSVVPLDPAEGPFPF